MCSINHVPCFSCHATDCVYTTNTIRDYKLSLFLFLSMKYHGLCFYNFLIIYSR
jgi:hypothetical protein